MAEVKREPLGRFAVDRNGAPIAGAAAMDGEKPMVATVTISRADAAAEVAEQVAYDRGYAAGWAAAMNSVQPDADSI